MGMNRIPKQETNPLVTSGEHSFPKVSSSQKIGRLADKSFRANCPTSWLVTSESGDNDFGIDFQIQIDTDSAVKDCFRLQLKGTTKPKLVENESNISVVLNVSTVNYYSRITEPILLVLCDLSYDNNHPKNCPLYYVWISDGMKRITDIGIENEQESVTFHIPTENRLSETTDLTHDLANFRRLAKVGEQLDMNLQSDRPALSPVERTELIARATRGLSQRSPYVLESLAKDPTSSWVDAQKGTLQWYLNEAKMALSSGNSESASRALGLAESLAKVAKPIEEADYWYMVGRLRSLNMDDCGAREAFEEACRLSNDSPTHLVPWGEAVLRSSFLVNSNNDFRTTIERLSSPDPNVVGMRSRLIAAEGRYQEAWDLVADLPAVEGNFARAVILSMQAKSDELILECNAGLANSGLPDTTRLAFLVLRARGWFSRSIGGIPIAGFDSELPMSGPSGAIPEYLHAAWNDICEAVKILRESGWTGNVDLIADIWAATASMLGLQRATLPLMAEAANKRPSIQSIQESVESLAAQVQEFKIALEANGRQPETERSILRRIALLHLNKRHKECIENFMAHETLVPTLHDLYGYSVGMAIESAERLVRPELAKRWLEKLEGMPEQGANLAIIRFVNAISENQLARDQALADLESSFESMNRPQTIAIQLFKNYDPTNQLEAVRCVDVAEQVGKERLFDTSDTLHLAQAFITLKMWNQLLDLSNQSISRFRTDDRITAIGSIALDHLGRSAEAHKRLFDIIKNPGADPLALKTYITIAARSGFTIEAMACLERVLEIESTPSRRLECLKHMYGLIQITDPTSQRLIDIAWEIGKCANPDDEAQEGLFLLAMTWATLPSGSDPGADKTHEYQNRLNAFINRFPESTILKRVSISQDASAGQFIQKLKELSGVTEEQIRWRLKMEEHLRRGLMFAPFAWRPRNILGSIPDLPTLWGISKISKSDDRQFHLQMAQAGWEPMPYKTMRARVPLLDLISLLVVSDLGLVDRIFDIFPRIAVSKGTLMEMQDLLSPLRSCPFREMILKLQTALKRHFSDIDQPSIDIPDDGLQSPIPWSVEEVSQLSRTSTYLLYSDDLIFRNFVQAESPKQPSICTLDVLHALDTGEFLSATEVAKCIATLAIWRVGIVVTERYQIAILPDELGDIRSTDIGVRLLQSDPLCNGLFARLWDQEKAFPDLLGQMGALVRSLASKPANKLESIQSLIAFWLSKVRLHPKGPGSAEQILAWLLVSALMGPMPIADELSRRLWNLYKNSIEFLYGDRMDEDKYRSAITLAGYISAKADFNNKLQGYVAVHSKICAIIVNGTSDSDRYCSAYNAEILRLKQRGKG